MGGVPPCNGFATDKAVDELLRHEVLITTCDPVVMEIVAGGRSERHAGELHRLLARATLITTHPTDWADAARIYRAGRRQGITIRKLIDCLIAAIALRSGEPVLHNDADFEAIAQVVPLVVSRS